MNPHLVLNSEAFQGWIVYAWMRGPEFLYIGSSAKGITRFTNHHVIGKVERFQVDDKIDIYYCQSQYDAVALELRMILDKKPRYNTQSTTIKGQKVGNLIKQSWRDSFREKSKGPFIINGEN